MRDGLHPVLAGPSRLLRLKLNLAENLRYCRPSPRNRWEYSYIVRLNDRGADRLRQKVYSVFNRRCPMRRRRLRGSEKWAYVSASTATGPMTASIPVTNSSFRTRPAWRLLSGLSASDECRASAASACSGSGVAVRWVSRSSLLPDMLLHAFYNTAVTVVAFRCSRDATRMCGEWGMPQMWYPFALVSGAIGLWLLSKLLGIKTLAAFRGC